VASFNLLSITMDSDMDALDMEEDEVFTCRWAGCPEEFEDEVDWVKHIAVHVFTLKAGERTPWLGPPELDPARHQRASVVSGAFFSGEKERDTSYNSLLSVDGD
jgi:hypothetical protein